MKRWGVGWEMRRVVFLGGGGGGENMKEGRDVKEMREGGKEGGRGMMMKVRGDQKGDEEFRFMPGWWHLGFLV